MSNTLDKQRKQHQCPHCGRRARVRMSRRLSPVFSCGIIECEDILGCRWRGTFGVEITATLSPSLCPNSAIVLPQSPHATLDSPYFRPRQHALTKNPMDPHRDQLPLFSS